MVNKVKGLPEVDKVPDLDPELTSKFPSYDGRDPRLNDFF